MENIFISRIIIKVVRQSTGETEGDDIADVVVRDVDRGIALDYFLFDSWNGSFVRYSDALDDFYDISCVRVVFTSL